MMAAKRKRLARLRPGSFELLDHDDRVIVLLPEWKHPPCAQIGEELGLDADAERMHQTEEADRPGMHEG